MVYIVDMVCAVDMVYTPVDCWHVDIDMGDEGGEVDEGDQGMTTRALVLLKIIFYEKVS